MPSNRQVDNLNVPYIHNAMWITKRKKILTHTIERILKNTNTLSEISQMQKNKYSMIPYT